MYSYYASGLGLWHLRHGLGAGLTRLRLCRARRLVTLVDECHEIAYLDAGTGLRPRDHRVDLLVVARVLSEGCQQILDSIVV